MLSEIVHVPRTHKNPFQSTPDLTTHSFEMKAKHETERGNVWLDSSKATL
jgi:hypothetical protein